MSLVQMIVNIFYVLFNFREANLIVFNSLLILFFFFVPTYLNNSVSVGKMCV